MPKVKTSTRKNDNGKNVHASRKNGLGKNVSKRQHKCEMCIRKGPYRERLNFY